ncbi:ABC transporter permease [Mycetocola spongiae]|uniref:ABC transporter permease n=1 Tax=Mycetocola spongiae TaxID=2859226 RepID=UPI001CF437D6|nr:ABC transporter permease [Mycetocola spongiae]UCR89338.1 ABC transporter permease [Mycetocola spongiae]
MTPTSLGSMTVLRRVLPRLAGALGVLWAAATVTFFAVRLIPGDPAQALLGGPGSQASAEALARVRAENGLDLPLFTQYLAFLGRLLRGDLGQSYSLHEGVAAVIGEQLGGTLILALCALAAAWALALALALWSVAAGPLASRVAAGLEMTAASLPHFWLGSALILLFSSTLGWLPAIGTGDARGLILPTLTLAIPLAGFLAQLLRESLLAAAEEPFILTARSRGESEAGIFLRHTLRHAAPPAIGITGWAFGSLLSGAVVVETIFARPGLGRTLVGATQVRDVPLVVGIVLIAAAAYLLVSLVSDLTERALIPTVRGRS